MNNVFPDGQAKAFQCRDMRRRGWIIANEIDVNITVVGEQNYTNRFDECIV